MRDSLVRLNRSCSHVEKLAATNYPADAELNGPAILLQELVADEGVDRVIRAVERGLMVYDATTTFLVQRPAFDVIADGRFNPDLVLGEAL